jgi:hypothetical protein
MDLKCSNLFCDLTDRQEPLVVVGDLGISKRCINSLMTGKGNGSRLW